MAEATPTTLFSESRLDRARRVFREYYAMCFWHLRKDVDITEADIPVLIHGLRTNGNRQAFLEAAQLAEDPSSGE